MESSTSVSVKEILRERNAQIVRNNQCPSPKFKDYPNITLTGDEFGALFSIPPRVLMIHNVQLCYMCKVAEIGDYELQATYDKLYENGVLIDETKIVFEKGLTYSLAFMKVIKVEWIKMVLSRVHDMKIWLEGGPIKINKAIIFQVTGYPTLADQRQ